MLALFFPLNVVFLCLPIILQDQTFETIGDSLFISQMALSQPITSCFHLMQEKNFHCKWQIIGRVFIAQKW